MSSYWKSKVLPQFQKVFDKGGKKAAAAEFVKSFGESKEDIHKEYEEKKDDLHPKVLEIYEASPPQIKALVKDPKPNLIKKNSAAVTKFLDELAKIEFPGAKQVSEAAAKSGPALVSGPIIVLLEKVKAFLPTEEPPAAPAAEEPAAETTAEKVEEEIKAEIEAAEAAAEPSEPTAVAEEAVAEAGEEPKPVEEEPPKEG